MTSCVRKPKFGLEIFCKNKIVARNFCKKQNRCSKFFIKTKSLLEIFCKKQNPNELPLTLHVKFFLEIFRKKQNRCSKYFIKTKSLLEIFRKNKIVSRSDFFCQKKFIKESPHMLFSNQNAYTV